MVRIYALTFLKDAVIGSFWVFWAASVLKSGGTLSDAAFSLGVFFTCSALLDAPSGYWADKWGRKKLSQIGMIAWILGFGIKAFDLHNLIWVSFGLVGIGITFINGAFVAWTKGISETIAKKSTVEFIFSTQIMGRLAMMTASLGGAWLFNRSPEMLWMSVLSVSFAIFLGSLSLPSDQGKNVAELPLKLSVVKSALSSNMIWFFLGCAFFGIEGAFRNMTWTPYVKEFGAGATEFGIINASFAVARLFGLFLYRFYVSKKVAHNHQSAHRFLIFGILAFALAEFIAVFMWSVPSFLLGYGWSMVFVAWYYSFREVLAIDLAPQRIRATVYSLSSFSESILSGLTCFAMVLFIDDLPIRFGWAFGAVALVFSAGAFGVGMRSKAK